MAQGEQISEGKREGEMTKQQEIAFGVEQIIIAKFQQLMPDRYPLSLNAEGLREKLFTYLHSQGCVLKVDGELCPSPYLDGCPEDKGFNHCRNIHTKAGYVATMPLIEVKG